MAFAFLPFWALSKKESLKLVTSLLYMKPKALSRAIYKIFYKSLKSLNSSLSKDLISTAGLVALLSLFKP